jgi:hypothetical protein
VTHKLLEHESLVSGHEELSGRLLAVGVEVRTARQTLDETVDGRGEPHMREGRYARRTELRKDHTTSSEP